METPPASPAVSVVKEQLPPLVANGEPRIVIVQSGLTQKAAQMLVDELKRAGRDVWYTAGE